MEPGVPELAYANDYHEARERFSQALDEYEAATGRRFERERCVIDEERDLSIDAAHLRPPSPRKLYVAVAGTHGVEGYAGNAIERALLSQVLRKIDLDSTGLWLVHALNPAGMHDLRRVTRNNVDLNRNFATPGSALYDTDSHIYEQLRPMLCPRGRYDGTLRAHLGFMSRLGAAVVRHGFSGLRQVTLAGQYTVPEGVFFGGKAPEPETQFFARSYEPLAAAYEQVLLTDFHTGYGERGKAYSLFARAQSPKLAELTRQGVLDEHGHDQAYTAHGDLVGYACETAKRVRPNGVFDGVVIELGTRGLGKLEQIGDLHAVVRENQIWHHGATHDSVETLVLRSFRELFHPSDPLWRRAILRTATQHVEDLLRRCGFA